MNELDLQGPRFGCGLGQCGSCSVLVNGVEARSCMTPVSSVARQVNHDPRRASGLVRRAEEAGERARAASRAASDDRRAGRSVRLLLQRDDREGCRASGEDAAAERVADSLCDERASVPMRDVSADTESDPACFARHEGGDEMNDTPRLHEDRRSARRRFDAARQVIRPGAVSRRRAIARREAGRHLAGDSRGQYRHHLYRLRRARARRVHGAPAGGRRGARPGHGPGPKRSTRHHRHSESGRNVLQRRHQPRFAADPRRRRRGAAGAASACIEGARGAGRSADGVKRHGLRRGRRRFEVPDGGRESFGQIRRARWRQAIQPGGYGIGPGEDARPIHAGRHSRTPQRRPGKSGRHVRIHAACACAGHGARPRRAAARPECLWGGREGVEPR